MSFKNLHHNNINCIDLALQKPLINVHTSATPLNTWYLTSVFWPKNIVFLSLLRFNPLFTPAQAGLPIPIPIHSLHLFLVYSFIVIKSKVSLDFDKKRGWMWNKHLLYCKAPAIKIIMQSSNVVRIKQIIDFIRKTVGF